MVIRALYWTDIWLLQAIYVCERQVIYDSEKSDRPPSVENIIAAADYINHAVMTFEEFGGGLRNLKQAGLLQQIGQELKLARKATELFQKFEIKGIYEQAELVRRELGVEAPSKDHRPQEQLAGPYLDISRERYDSAAESYLRRNRS